MGADDLALSPAQRHVLETLKRHGDATAEELAESLDISTSAVRQHLTFLRSVGLTTASPERGHAGRPAERHVATPRSETLFAGAPGELAIELLGHVQAEDPNLVDRVFQRHRRQVVEDARAQIGGGPLGDRVRALTDHLDAEGYLADCEDLGDGSYRISLHGCPMWAVASRYRQACAAELGFIEDLIPGATATRLTHKTTGAHSCTYEIRPSR